MADIKWKMLQGQEAVELCVEAMHALIYRQRNCFLDTAVAGASTSSDMEDSIDYVWRRILKYVNDSRISSSGKADFIRKMQHSFSTEEFVLDTRTWINSKIAKENPLPPETPEATSKEGVTSQEAEAAIPEEEDRGEDVHGGYHSTEEIDDDIPLRDRAVSEDHDEEDLLVQFSRRLAKYSEKRLKFKGFGYGLTVYALYFMFAFLCVYVYETSHCTASADDDIYIVPGVNGSRGMTLPASEIRVVKNSLTVGRFGGVYGIDSGSKTYMFSSEDSDAIYEARWGTTVPRPSCATTCKPQFVCHDPVCIVRNSTYDAVSVDITTARVGTECHCKTAPVWDSCGLSGWLLMIVRNYWLTMYYGIAILEITLFMFATLAVAWPSPPQDSFDDKSFRDRRTQDIKKHKVALLIAHYGNFGALADTLEPALEVFPPENIFVCHNANFRHPFDKGAIGDTLEKMRAVETKLGLTKRINYMFSCEGNKTLALYVLTLTLTLTLTLIGRKQDTSIICKCG